VKLSLNKLSETGVYANVCFCISI